MNRQAGLTLIEVVLAMAIIGIAVLPAAMLIGSSVRASGTARAVQNVTSIAQAEVNLRRQVALSAGLEQDCLHEIPTGYSCQVDVFDCELVGGTLACAQSGVSSPVAYRVLVAVTGPRTYDITLQTLVSR